MASKKQKIITAIEVAIAWLLFDEQRDRFVVIKAATYSAARKQLVEWR